MKSGNQLRRARLAVGYLGAALSLGLAGVARAQVPTATDPCAALGQERAGEVVKIVLQGCCAVIERPRLRRSPDRLQAARGAVLCTEDRIVVTDASPAAYVLLHLTEGSDQIVRVQASKPYMIYHSGDASSALDADEPALEPHAPH